MKARTATYLIAIFLLLVTALGTQAHEPFIENGEVTRVSDGDTLFIDTGEDEWLEIRLYGVDCPETEWTGRWPAQQKSAEAKEFTIDLVLGKTVSVRLKDERTYGRAVGEVFINGESLSRELLRADLGWWNKKYEPWDKDLERLERSARSAEVGIWSDPNPVPPWTHRHNHR